MCRRRRDSPTAAAADLLRGFEDIADGCTISLINPLIHTNASAVSDPAYRRFLFWINAARDVVHSPIRLGRYAPDTIIDGDGPFHILTENTLVDDHLVPNYAELFAHRAHLAAARGRAIAVPAPCLFACHPGVNVWSHWLLDTLPRILLAERAHPGRFAFVVPAAITDPDSPRFLVRSVLESLAAYGIARHRLLRLQPGTAYCFDNLFDLTGLAADGPHPDIIRLLRRPNIQPAAQPRKLLATLRGPGELRPVISHAAVIDALRAGGAEFQDPAAAPFAEKIAAFRDAETIVGDLGSNLATAIFASPGAAIVTLAPAQWRDNYFAQYFQRLDIRHADIRGVPLPDPADPPGHHPHFLAPQHLEAGLAAARVARRDPGLVVDGRPIARAPGPVLLRIDFAAGGNAPEFRTGTFSAPEGTHTWSEGPECGLRIPCRRLDTAADLWLEIKGIGFVMKPHLLSRLLSVFVNGELRGSFDIEDLTHLHVHIPRGLAARARTLAVEFRHPVCPSPRSMGVSDDARPLGFMFEFVAIRAMQG